MAYRFLTSGDDLVAGGANNNVWHKLVPSKVSLFAWRLLQNKIPTRSNLVRRHVLQPNGNFCVGGCGTIETTYHLFIGCDIFRSVWHLVCHWLDISFVYPGWVNDHIFSLLIWRVYRDLHIFILRLFGLLLLGQFRRKETTMSSKIR